MTTTRPFRDVFREPQATYTLRTLPDPRQPITVYLNGLLQLEQYDYALNGQELTFLIVDTLHMDSLIIQVLYSA